MAESAPRSTLYFDPNVHAENPLKAFNDFCDTFLFPAIYSGISWGEFVGKMKTFYKPADNPTLRNYQFRNLSQRDDETFIAFITRVDVEKPHII